MFIPVAIHKDEGSVFGVTIPDVPGCFSSGETVEEALKNAQEAVIFHVEGLLEDGEFESLIPSNIEDLQASDEYSDALWALVDVDLSRLSNKQTRFNVSWPEYLLARVDEYAAAHHETRSGFLAKAAQQVLNQAR
ncbi:type II toxin-antitoxin system HicB family antitoxin [Uruburuella testudinis]|uniref:Type II toxin-antitoxin system HicB family antitoxin n=1 Tax=Uruburuella testudinis TaxID=1282863 RepID=A0ABY4DS61_9NEIS|nr:type II toxin-antitoxin system HicB family antitoxin [Uruburuella testudinis]UOO81555.1 type II toxin-antitoxin system HicB family antitoxin [Uruburuella testudinis]